MDYTEICNITREFMIAQGIAPQYIDRNETLYYDESGNVKHLIVKNGKLNAEIDTVFVLGGVQAEESISFDDLKTALGKNLTKELKSTKDLRGSFIDILSKDNFRRILKLIHDRGWHVHFKVVQVLYYGFVDIVDSIDDLKYSPYIYKAELYKVLKKNPEKTLSLFKKYKYPNIADNQVVCFLSDLLDMIDEVISEDAGNLKMNPYLVDLRCDIEKAKQQKSLSFIQDEEPHTWVSNFEQFYKQEILSLPNKTLVFDEEKQVMNFIVKQDIKINGKSPDNYCFRESSVDSMIQVCDYVVCILRKYMIFLDKLEPEVEAEISHFDETKMSNYKLLNQVLLESFQYNPIFINFTACCNTIAKYFKYMEMYGVDESDTTENAE